MLDLQTSRDQIDRIDKEIVKLFEDRMKIAQEVAAYKLSTGKKVFDRERETQKLIALKELASNEFNRHGIEELFIQIMSMSRKLQYSLLKEERMKLEFCEKSRLNITNNTNVVFFGEQGSYTEQATEQYFGENIKRFKEGTFKGVMEAIRDGKAEYGVLPIENSSTGNITDIYDLMIGFHHSIIGQHIVKIENCLLGLPGSSLETIETVYSHPQPILQCSKFLESHSNIKAKEYFSTSASAMKVIEENEKTKGVIGGKKVAEVYGLDILKENINDNNSNSTRFIILSNEKIYLEGANKISICFELPHESGTLYNMLSHFIYNNLNLTQIVSRPIAGKIFEYRFFVDFEGNLGDAGVKNALNGIQSEAINLQILGNYKK